MAGRCVNSPGPAQEVVAPMQRESTHARPPGTGSLLRHRHRSGAETWYGKWRADGRQVMRSLGPAVHSDGSQGLSSAEAEAALAAAIRTTNGVEGTSESIGIEEAGRRYIANRELLGLKPGTLIDYESHLRVHLVPFFGGRDLDEVDVSLIDEFVAAKRRQGCAIKSIHNYLGLLSGIFAFALKRGWCRSNPVAAAEKPRARQDHDIRYLSAEELAALLAALPDTELGRLQR